MRVDLPQCNNKLCRKCFDGNCTGSESDKTECNEFVREHQAEFLRKAKAICNSKPNCCGCPMFKICIAETPRSLADEADLVRKVMDYQIKEDAE